MFSLTSGHSSFSRDEKSGSWWSYSERTQYQYQRTQYNLVNQIVMGPYTTWVMSIDKAQGLNVVKPNLRISSGMHALAWHGPGRGAVYCHLDTSRSSGVWFVTFTLPMMQVDYTTKNTDISMLLPLQTGTILTDKLSIIANWNFLWLKYSWSSRVLTVEYWQSSTDCLWQLTGWVMALQSVAVRCHIFRFLTYLFRFSWLSSSACFRHIFDVVFVCWHTFLLTVQQLRCWVVWLYISSHQVWFWQL